MMTVNSPPSRGTGRPLLGLLAPPGPHMAEMAEMADIICDAYGWRRVAIAHPIHELVYSLDPMLSGETTVRSLVDRVGWGEATRHRIHGPETSRLLAACERELKETISPSLWVNLARQNAERLLDEGLGVLVTDLSGPVETRMVRSLGGKIIRIATPRSTSRHSHPDGGDGTMSTTVSDLTLHTGDDPAVLVARTIDAVEHLLRERPNATDTGSTSTKEPAA